MLLADWQWRTDGGRLAVVDWRSWRGGRELLAFSFADVCFRGGASQKATAWWCTGQFGDAIFHGVGFWVACFYWHY